MTGDTVGSLGPAGDGPKLADLYVLAADETGLPGIARILESVNGKCRGIAIIEIDGQSEVRELKKPANFELRWLCRDGAEPGRPCCFPRLYGRFGGLLISNKHSSGAGANIKPSKQFTECCKTMFVCAPTAGAVLGLAPISQRRADYSYRSRGIFAVAPFFSWHYLHATVFYGSTSTSCTDFHSPV